MWNNQRALNHATAVLMLLALLLLALAGLVWASQRPLFTLKYIQIEATGGMPLRHVNVATVRAAAVPRMLRNTHGNFFSVDLEAVRLAFESVAWVRRAQVRRAWPDRLIVGIEEHQILGTWDEGRLISRHGELFTANLDEAEADGNLPALSGPAGSEREVAERHDWFQKSFAPLGLVPVSVTLSARYAWTVQLDNGSEPGLTVELGRERDTKTLNERVERLVAAYPLVTARWPNLHYVDLRYPNGFALRAEGLRLTSDGAARPAAPRPILKPAASPASNRG